MNEWVPFLANESIRIEAEKVRKLILLLKTWAHLCQTFDRSDPWGHLCLFLLRCFTSELSTHELLQTWSVYYIIRPHNAIILFFHLSTAMMQSTIT